MPPQNSETFPPLFVLVLRLKEFGFCNYCSIVQLQYFRLLKYLTTPTLLPIAIWLYLEELRMVLTDVHDPMNHGFGQLKDAIKQIFDDFLRVSEYGQCLREVLPQLKESQEIQLESKVKSNLLR